MTHGKGTQIPASARRAVRTRDYDRCSRCGMPGAEWHHRRTRSVVDAHQHCPCNGVLLCSRCHSAVHRNPFEARRFGFIVSRHEREPSTVPIKTQQHGWVTLTCEATTSLHEYELTGEPDG